MARSRLKPRRSLEYLEDGRTNQVGLGWLFWLWIVYRLAFLSTPQSELGPGLPLRFQCCTPIHTGLLEEELHIMQRLSGVQCR